MNIVDFPIADNFVYLSAVIWISIVVRNGSINFDESKEKRGVKRFAIVIRYFYHCRVK